MSSRNYQINMRRGRAPYSRAKRFLLIFAVLLIIGGLAGAWLYSQINGCDGGAGAGQQESPSGGAASLSLADVPPYSGQPATELNGNHPYFEVDITNKPGRSLSELFSSNTKEPIESYETYGDLDRLGRCTAAEACLGTDLMPTEERRSIQNVRPTGWHTIKYDIIEERYLYNRCHLIAFILAGENDNERNLITGTRYLNTQGMEPYELEVMSYLYRTGNHVQYRITPVFEGDNLLASGVLMEAYSLEDKGKGVCFCVYCYNVQPGIEIDYATGESRSRPES